jgi:hypothetical protein
MIHLRATASTAEALIERAPHPDQKVGRPPGGNDLLLRVHPGGAGSTELPGGAGAVET